MADFEGDIEKLLVTKNEEEEDSYYTNYKVVETISTGYWIIDAEFRQLFSTINSQYVSTTSEQQNIKSLVNDFTIFFSVFYLMIY